MYGILSIQTLNNMHIHMYVLYMAFCSYHIKGSVAHNAPLYY